MNIDKEKLKTWSEKGLLVPNAPAAILALLAEIEQLREAHEQVCLNYNRVSFASEERGKQIDQLKAENEALRRDAERYRWLREPWQDQRLVRAWTSLEVMDENIDAAMAKGASHV